MTGEPRLEKSATRPKPVVLMPNEVKAAKLAAGSLLPIFATAPTNVRLGSRVKAAFAENVSALVRADIAIRYFNFLMILFFLCPPDSMVLANDILHSHN